MTDTTGAVTSYGNQYPPSTAKAVRDLIGAAAVVRSTGDHATAGRYLLEARDLHRSAIAGICAAVFGDASAELLATLDIGDPS